MKGSGWSRWLCVWWVGASGGAALAGEALPGVSDRAAAVMMRADLVVLAADNWDARSVGFDGTPPEYAWQLRSSVGDTRSVAAALNLHDLLWQHTVEGMWRNATPGERVRARGWLRAAKELCYEHLAAGQDGAKETATSRWGVSTGRAVWQILDGCLYAEIEWARVEEDAFASRAAWDERAENLCADYMPANLMLHTSTAIYSKLREYYLLAIESGDVDTALAIADSFALRARSACSMGGGGPWQRAESQALIARAEYIAGDFEAARARLERELDEWTYDNHGVMGAFRVYAVKAYVDMLEDLGDSAQLPELRYELHQLESHTWIDAQQDEHE